MPDQEHPARQPAEPSEPSQDSSVPSQQKGGRRRRGRIERDLTTGSAPRNLWFLSWPQVTEGFLTTVDQVADLIWVGRLGAESLAGFGVGHIYLMSIVSTRAGIDASMAAMVARAVGARRLSYANHVLLQSLTMTTIFSVVILLIGLFATEFLLRLLGLNEKVVSEAAIYMKVQMFAVVAMAYQKQSAVALQAAGDSVTPLKAETVSRVLHLVLSPILIFGLLGLPHLGVAGVGLAHVIGRSAAVAMNFYALTNGSSRLKLSFKGYRPDFPQMWSMVKIGTPAGVTGVQRGLSQIAVIAIVASFGAGPLAAFTVIRRVDLTAAQLSLGLGRAAGAIAGHNLAVHNVLRAKQTLWWALGFSAISSLVIAAPLAAFSLPIASFVIGNPDFAPAASTWIVILALAYLPLSAVYVMIQAFNTTGQTLVPMVVMVSTMWLVEVPLAFALSQLTDLGQFGVPWAMAIGAVVRLAFFFAYFLRGRWLKTGLL